MRMALPLYRKKVIWTQLHRRISSTLLLFSSEVGLPAYAAQSTQITASSGPFGFSQPNFPWLDRRVLRARRCAQWQERDHKVTQTRLEV